MKKIEGVVVHYTDGSRERLSAQQIMERFFGGFVQDPSQNTSGESMSHVPTEPRVTEPEKKVANVDFVKGTDIVSENKPLVIEPEKNIRPKRTITKSDATDKAYYAATMTRFPFGGPELKGKSLLECVLWDRKFMERVAQNKKGNNADLAKKIALLLARLPVTEDYD
jgi:hypothetical protein